MSNRTKWSHNLHERIRSEPRFCQWPDAHYLQWVSEAWGLAPGGLKQPVMR